MVLFLFSHLLACKNPTIFTNTMLQTLPFLSALLVSDLICQARSLTWVIVSGSSRWISMIKFNIIKICLKNTHFIARKYGITRFFIIIVYYAIIIDYFNEARQSSTASSRICRVWNWSVTYLIPKGFSEIKLAHITDCLSFTLIRNINK